MIGPHSFQLPQGLDEKQEKPTVSWRREQVIDALKRDFRMGLIFVVPFLDHFPVSVKNVALALDFEPAFVEKAFHQFLDTNLWSDTDGKIQVVDSFINLGELEISSYLTMATALATRMSEHGDCSYEFLLIATNETLKREFNSAVHHLIKEFVKKSKNVEKTTIVGWTHGWLNCFDGSKRGGTQ